jgi:hypothetical protein
MTNEGRREEGIRGGGADATRGGNMGQRGTAGQGAQGGLREDANALKEDARRLADELGEVRNTASLLLEEGRAVLADVQETLDIEGRVERNPLGTVAAAAAIGFVLGGGIFRPLASRAMRYGFKALLLPLITERIVSMASGGRLSSVTEVGENVASAVRSNLGGGEERGEGGEARGGPRRQQQQRGGTRQS